MFALYKYFSKLLKQNDFEQNIFSYATRFYAKKFFIFLLTIGFLERIIHYKFEYHKNDDDEDGRNAEFQESCRLVRGNKEVFQRPITSELEDRKRE